MTNQARATYSCYMLPCMPPPISFHQSLLTQTPQVLSRDAKKQLGFFTILERSVTHDAPDHQEMNEENGLDTTANTI